MDKYNLHNQPQEWDLKPLSECCSAVTETCDPNSAIGMPYLGLEHLASGLPFIIDIGDPAQVRSAKTVFQRQDVLYGKLRPYLRKAVLAPYNGICSTDIIVMRSNSEILSEFLVFLVHSDQFVNRAKATTSGVNHPRTAWSKLKPFFIPVPPLSEQIKIAALLLNVQRAIEQQERLIALSTELKNALVYKLFTEGTRGEKQKQTEIGLVPESWKVVSIGDTCDIMTSSMTYKQLEQAENLFDGAEVMGVKVSDMNIGGNEIEFRTANLKRNIKNNEAQKRTVPADVIIFPKRGAAIATNKKRLTTTWTVLDPNLIAVRPHKGTYYRYLYHWFNTFDLARITDPGPTPQLNKKDVSPLKYPKPDETTQKEISDIIDTVDQKTGNHVELKLLLNELFLTLLHQLMTAQIRVNDLDLTELDYEPIATGEEEVS